MSLFDSMLSIGAKMVGTAIGGPLGGMIADKLMNLLTDLASKFLSQAKDSIQQSSLPDAAKNIFSTAYDAGFGS